MEDNVTEKINQLKTFTNSPFPILSLYLGMAQKKSPAFPTLSSMLHSQVHKYLDENNRKTFKVDLEHIDSYLKYTWDSHGKKSVAFFSAGKNLWEMLDFEFYLPPLCLVSHSPYTKPITKAQDDYKRYMVLVADREKAKIFTVHLGELKEHKEIIDETVPQKVKSGDDTWDQQNKIFRHIENHLHRHLQLITKTAGEFLKNNPVSFIIIGGHKEMIPKIRKHLKYPLNKLVRGQFITELNIPLNEIFLKSKKVAAQISKENI